MPSPVICVILPVMRINVLILCRQTLKFWKFHGHHVHVCFNANVDYKNLTQSLEYKGIYEMYGPAFSELWAVSYQVKLRMATKSTRKMRKLTPILVSGS